MLCHVSFRIYLISFLAFSDLLNLLLLNLFLSFSLDSIEIKIQNVIVQIEVKLTSDVSLYFSALENILNTF